MKKQTEDGFYLFQIDEGGIFTYLCCRNCKPHIVKEYKNLKLNVIKEEFLTPKVFKKLNPKITSPCCSYCERPFYQLSIEKPIKKRNESKKQRWNRVLNKYCINQKLLLDKCSKYGKRRAEEILLSDVALWELTQTIQQKCRYFIEMKKITEIKRKIHYKNK